MSRVYEKRLVIQAEFDGFYLRERVREFQGTIITIRGSHLLFYKDSIVRTFPFQQITLPYLKVKVEKPPLVESADIYNPSL